MTLKEASKRQVPNEVSDQPEIADRKHMSVIGKFHFFPGLLNMKGDALAWPTPSTAELLYAQVYP